MNRSLLAIIILVISSCNVKKVPGNYSSVCLLNGKHSVKLDLHSDGKFQYYWAYVDSPVNGYWKVDRNKIILSSDVFLKKDTSEFKLKLKNSNNPGVDIYKKKGSRLYIVNTEGIKKFCYLEKVAK